MPVIAIRAAPEFGRAVRERRHALGLTQEDLARRCGVGKRFIVDLEAGKSTIQLGKAFTAAREVGMVLADTAGQAPAVAVPAPVSTQSDPYDALADLPRFRRHPP